MNLIIGLGNKARNGKDTAAKFLVEEFPLHNFYVTSFAKQLKLEVDTLGIEELSAKYGVAIEPPLHDDLCKTKYGKQPRLLQVHGQHQRSSNPWYWVRKLQDEISNLPQGTIVLVTDVRYFSEAYFIKENKGYMVNVRRANEDGSFFISNDRDPKHTSEVELDGYNYDYIIEHKTLDELKEGVIQVFDDMLRLESSMDEEFAKDVFGTVQKLR
jgi:hypothetical protein